MKKLNFFRKRQEITGLEMRSEELRIVGVLIV